jgi:hypothetical protein
MGLNRILVAAAVVCFALTALSAFSSDINLNELGWLSLGLALWAGSSLAVGMAVGAGRRRRALR